MSEKLEKLLKDAETEVITNWQDVKDSMDAFWALSLNDLWSEARNTKNLDYIIHNLVNGFEEVVEEYEDYTIKDLTLKLAEANDLGLFRDDPEEDFQGESEDSLQGESEEALQGDLEEVDERDPILFVSFLALTFARQLLFSQNEYTVSRFLALSLDQCISLYGRDWAIGLREKVAEAIGAKTPELPLDVTMGKALLALEGAASRAYAPGVVSEKAYIAKVQNACDLTYDLLVRYPAKYLVWRARARG